MNLTVRLREEAAEDLNNAASWYELQLPGLGHEFLDKALSLLDPIPAHPLQHPIVHKNVRRALLSRFPFGVYYSVEEEFILVYGVMHASRNPAQWQSRT